MDPMEVTFALPEKYLDFLTHRPHHDISVHLKNINGEPLLLEGYLEAFDNNVNPSTGTVSVKARFKNPKNDLWPGEYVTVILDIPMDEKLWAIPLSAMQIGQKGPYVFVYNPEAKTVHLRPIKLKRTTEDLALVEGLAKGEIVVTSGHLRLKDGIKVELLHPLKAREK